MKKIFYIGDSTVQFNKYDTYPQTGMSQALERYTAEDVQVSHHGKNGRSTKWFLDEGRFEPIRRDMGAGDFLFIQFSHNDEKDAEKLHTDPWGSFQENLRFFIREARAAGAYPVLITPIARRFFDADGVFHPTHGEYPDAIRAVGREMDVPVADLTALTEELVARLGAERSAALYVTPQDIAHLSPDGAMEMAGLLCQELRRFGGVYDKLLYVPVEEEW